MSCHRKWQLLVKLQLKRYLNRIMDRKGLEDMSQAKANAISFFRQLAHMVELGAEGTNSVLYSSMTQILLPLLLGSDF